MTDWFLMVALPLWVIAIRGESPHLRTIAQELTWIRNELQKISGSSEL